MYSFSSSPANSHFNCHIQKPFCRHGAQGRPQVRACLHVKLLVTCTDNDHSLSSDIIAVRGLDGAFPARVHEHLLRERSRKLIGLIEDAKQAGERDAAITIGLVHTAMHRWCVWLYGQPLYKESDDPERAVVDICGIHQFSLGEGDIRCANACVDALREIFLREHDKLQVELDTLLDFLAGETHAVHMLVDVLVYGPYARSGKTWEWLDGARVEEKWVDFFYQLSLAFAKRAAEEAVGKEDGHLDVVLQHAYHIKDKESGACCGLAAEVVGDVSNPAILFSSKDCLILTHDYDRHTELSGTCP